MWGRRETVALENYLGPLWNRPLIKCLWPHLWPSSPKGISCPGTSRMISDVCGRRHRGWQEELRGKWGGDGIWSISTRGQKPLCLRERETSRMAQDTENSPVSFMGKEYPDHSPILHHHLWCSLASGQWSLVYLRLEIALPSEPCTDALALFLPLISAVSPLNCYFFYWLENQYLPLWWEGGCEEKISSICDVLRE